MGRMGLMFKFSNIPRLTTHVFKHMIQTIIDLSDCLPSKCCEVPIIVKQFKEFSQFEGLLLDPLNQDQL